MNHEDRTVVLSALNEPGPLTEEEEKEIAEAEAIHGEMFLRPRDYVTCGLKMLQAKHALREIMSDAAFTKEAQDRASFALSILKDEDIDEEVMRRMGSFA